MNTCSCIQVMGEVSTVIELRSPVHLDKISPKKVCYTLAKPLDDRLPINLVQLTTAREASRISQLNVILS